METKLKYDYKKTPLMYQITEYDCGTTSVLNAIKYLFNREEIAPEMYKRILQETLDKNFNDQVGKGGTSNQSLKKLCDELFVKGTKELDIIAEEIPEEDISIYNKELENEINNGNVAILQVYQGGLHYVLLTKIDEEFAYLFDPYYLPINYYDNDIDIEIIKDKSFEYNRKVRKERLDSNSKLDFSLLHGKKGQIILLKKVK